MHQYAKVIMLLGGLIFLIGLGYYFLGDRLKFIGNLPGDFRYKNDGFSFYFPFTTMLLLSIIINVLIRVYKTLF